MSNLFRKGIDDCQQGLASPSSNERIMAVQGLTKVDDPRAIGLLVDALRDTSSEVRSAAATSLMILGDSRGFEPFLRLLSEQVSDDPSEVAITVLESVVGMDLLVEALENHPDEEIRCGAAWVLCWAINDRVANKALTKACDEDHSEKVRQIAADALGRVPTPNPSIIKDYNSFYFKYECPLCHRMVASHWRECPDCHEPLFKDEP